MSNKHGPVLPLYIAFLGFASIGLLGGALGVAWVSIQTTFGLRLDALGVLLTALTVGRMLTSFSSGQAVVHFGMGVYLVCGCLLTLGGLLAFTFASVWPVLVLAYFVVGLGVGVVDAGLNIFVAAHYSASRMNWLHAAKGVGLTVGPVIVTLLVINLELPWRWSYVVLVGMQILLTTAFALTLPRWQVQAENAPKSEIPSAPITATLRLVIVWLSLAVFFIYSGVEIGTGQLLYSLLVTGRRVDPEVAGFWVSIYWGSFTVGRILFGIVIDKFEPRKLVRLSLAGIILGAALIWWNPMIGMSFIGLTVMGFTMAAIFPTLVSMTPQRVGQSHTPNAIGFQIGVAGLGGGILVALAGSMAVHLGLEAIPPFLLMSTLLVLLLHELIIRQETRIAVIS